MQSQPKIVRKKKRSRKIRRPYMDSATAFQELERIYDIGGSSVEKQVLETFPKSQWFVKNPTRVAPYTQFNGAPTDSKGRKWGNITEEDGFLAVCLPVTRKFHETGRVIAFPDIGEIIDTPGIGKFIVEDVIVPQGSKVTAKVKIKRVK